MTLKDSAYRRLAMVVFISTLIWYFSLFFTGTSSTRSTLVAVIGVTVLFLISAFLFALGNAVKMALVAFFLAVTSVLIMFLVAGFVESLQLNYLNR